MKRIKSGNPEFAYNEIKVMRKSMVALTLTLMFTLIILSFILMTFSGCNKDDSTAQKSYAQTNLVSDVAGYGALRVDANLANPWGIAIGPTGAFWISANHTGYSTIYDRNGAQLLPSVLIPSGGVSNGGSPTGVVYNGNSLSFLGSKYIYAGEDGTISIWANGLTTTMVVDRSSFNAVYKGIAIATDGGADFLYVANFKGNNIDVFDANFNFVTTKEFNDATIPAGFAPFNIYNHDNKLYVMYAKLKGPDNEDDEAGAGNGYVNIFNPNGTFIKRFASQGTLNSPWALVDAPAGFGQGDDIILVGNFGDGKINVFNEDGHYKGQLANNGNIISIEGLWALAFPENGIPAGDQNQLFFTAGPADETHGVFGYLSLK
ncbi:MAG: TIGR03118 family protein [Saprospiraceae bacterium]